RADRWSDYDFHLVSNRPRDYRDPAVLQGIGNTWLTTAQPAFGNATKLTAILDGAVEADFVVLSSLDLRAAFTALRFPSLQSLWPAVLKDGVRDLRIVACPGWKVIIGGPSWERRYARLGTEVPWPPLTAQEFERHVNGFWSATVWTTKKVVRGELRAADREYHRVMLEKLWLLLEVEARDSGRAARPEARHAESWLRTEELAGTAPANAADAAGLREAMRRTVDLFSQVSVRIAQAKGWQLGNTSAARTWLRQ